MNILIKFLTLLHFTHLYPSMIYLWEHMSKSFFLPSTISSKKSSSCPIIPSAPHCKTWRKLFNSSTLSWTSTSTPYWIMPSISIFSSSMAKLDLCNSYRRIPGCDCTWPIALATRWCRFAVEATSVEAEPEVEAPPRPTSCSPRLKLVSGQQ